MDALKILESGPLTTIQDKGRKGYQKFGMPVAGAMDLFSYRVANLLVGNEDNAAAIEFTMQGPKVEFLQDLYIAITGAETIPFVDNRPVPMWETIFVSKGSILSFQGLKSGLRGYLAICGGVDVPPVMGSRSTYLRGKIGGFKGRKLKAGDILKVNAFEKLSGSFYCRLPKNFIPIFKERQEIRVLLGPQKELFKQESIEKFLTSQYEVTAQSDRMGYRLAGPEIEHLAGADIISDGIPHGAIQVPGHGQPIVMLADRQTTGGYAKLATVISVDLNKMAQLRPGDKISFKEVSLDEAHQIFLEQENVFKEIEQFSPNKSLPKVYRLKISGREYITCVEEIKE